MINYPETYHGISPRCELALTELYTVHYYENWITYCFPGERHDFWELMYVDRGAVIMSTDQEPCTIKMERGDLRLLRPNEFHKFYTYGPDPSNLVVASFRCDSPDMDYFRERPLWKADSVVRHLLGQLLDEAQKAFAEPLSDPVVEQFHSRPGAPFGSEQMVKTVLEMLLIHLRRMGDADREKIEATQAQVRLADDYVKKAIEFMQENLRNPITLNDICAHAMISRPQVQKLFRQLVGTSPMRYFKILRIKEAKYMIRRGNQSFTEIADQLCYSSVHHFSKQFHDLVGVSPTDYANSVRVFQKEDEDGLSPE